MPLSPSDHDFARFIDACTRALDEAAAEQAARALVALAYTMGRGSALSEFAAMPDPSTPADRHLRYSAGLRMPAPRSELKSQADARREAQAWGFRC